MKKNNTDFPAEGKPEFYFMKNEVLFEDNHFIAVNKLPSDIVQGDKTGDTPLSEIVKQFLKEKYNKPGDAYLGVPHRIDRPTSGVIVFAKTGKALSRMNKLFQEKEVRKKYWAIVGNKPPKTKDILNHNLVKNQKNNKSKVVSKQHKKSKEAKLEYKLLHSFNNYYLLEVNPFTGRHHQIRVQLSAIGCPIKGDVKYGFKRTNKDASIHLHAREIEFTHPVKNETLKITAPPPVHDALWKEALSQAG